MKNVAYARDSERCSRLSCWLTSVTKQHANLACAFFFIQLCGLIFGSWTYSEEDIIFSLAERGVNLDDYSFSSIWDIIEAPAMLRMRKSRIEFQVRIRRKPLFYTVVLIVPTVLMAFLSMMVFYLPAGAGEKVTLTISVLLSLVVFLLLVSKILPPTSITVPLMAKYLLLTFVLNIITILVTVIIINVFFRGPTTHRMPGWVAKSFLEFLPRILLMKRPKPPVSAASKIVRMSDEFFDIDDDDVDFSNIMVKDEQLKIQNSEVVPMKISNAIDKRIWRQNYYKTIDAIEYITDHLRSDEETQQV